MTDEGGVDVEVCGDFAEKPAPLTGLRLDPVVYKNFVVGIVEDGHGGLVDQMVNFEANR